MFKGRIIFLAITVLFVGLFISSCGKSKEQPEFELLSRGTIIIVDVFPQAIWTTFEADSEYADTVYYGLEAIPTKPGYRIGKVGSRIEVYGKRLGFHGRELRRIIVTAPDSTVTEYFYDDFVGDWRKVR